jgi:hypothetical protein
MNRLLMPMFALLALLCAPAQAGRPLLSETADVPDAGSCELEAALAQTRSSGLPSLRSSDAAFACGVGAQTQAGFGLTRASGDGNRFNAARLVGKTTLLAPEAGRTGWGIGYGIGAEKTPDLAWRLESLGVLAAATRELGAGLLGHANLGWNRSRAAKQNTTFWSLGIETTSDFTLAADLFGDDRNKPGVSAGLGYSFGAGFSANASYALLLENPRVKQLTLGAKFAF